MTVLIDDRAGSRDLIDFPPLHECGELTRLDSADALIVGNGRNGPVLVGVEVKSIWDLLSSSSTGRLQATQLPAMLSSYEINWLLYYTPYRPAVSDGSLQIQGRNDKWTKFSLGRSNAVPYGFIESLLLDIVTLHTDEADIHVKHVANMREAAMWIGVLYRWWSKPWDKHKGMRKFDRSRDITLMPGVDGDLLTRARVAAQLPGMGFERAVAAAQHFPSIRAMMSATVAEWEQVPGVGKVIAKAIIQSIGE